MYNPNGYLKFHSNFKPTRSHQNNDWKFFFQKIILQKEFRALYLYIYLQEVPSYLVQLLTLYPKERENLN